jgi:hypothetical protein
MKISSLGPNEIPQKRASEASEFSTIRSDRSDDSSATRSGSQSGIEASVNPTRSFTEALVIAHTARSIINRAMEIASQLQGLAARSLSGSSIDQAEITRVVSAANAVMSETSGQPAQAVTVPNVNGASRTHVAIDYASVRENIESVRIQAQQLGEGAMSDVAQINSALAALGKQQESVSAVQRELQRHPVAQALTDIERTDDARALTERTSMILSSKPAAALALQGNIHPQRAGDLLG